MQIDVNVLNTILFLVMSALGIIALLLSMGYMIYGEEEEE
jgi:hypothetical protein